MKNPLKKIFGTRNERVLVRLNKYVQAINALEPQMKELSDEALRGKTDEFRKRYEAGENLQNLMPEAFAVVREASVRALGLRHFDVQLIGGMVLHDGKIAEMRTGEGKTLVATLAAYLNAIPGKGIHVVTVNDYLAKRDAEWMAPIYEFLGLTVGTILPNMDVTAKRAAYTSDIVYGTNNEFGFDYLRDNMAFSLEDKVQRELFFAIVDEVDSILIDEARTPLIISGPTEGSSDLYLRIDKLVPKLVAQKEEDGPGDYALDEKSKQAFLTESGHERVEELFVQAGLLQPGESLYDPANIILMHHLNASMRAHALFHRDVDYIVKNGEVVIVDEHTGRTMEGRRWSDGLHQAVEAKEGVKVLNENQTLASITFQNYFRLYEKLSGMTGTADTEAYEFQQIYGLEVIVIPTNEPMVRADNPDRIYLTAEEKFGVILDEIRDCRERKQPVLVGTASIETSESLSDLLKKQKIEHQVLNAKQHEREAHVIAQAGRPGTVTIATNMAGRGTDIVLGGNMAVELASVENPTAEQEAAIREAWKERHAQVLAAGGLHILGTERHESRRIDNQLRGRAGRQGDPGSSRFYLSLEDNLMRIFASDRVSALMRRLGMGKGEAIEHRMVSRAIENAQRKVEGHNFDIRKQLLEFDDVANEQRKVVYEQRNELMAATDIKDTINAITEDVVIGIVGEFIPPGSLDDQWDVAGLERQIRQDFDIKVPVHEWIETDNTLDEATIQERITQAVREAYRAKEAMIGEEQMREIERAVMLQTLDMHWKEHLAAMDYLREGIHLRGYAQKDPRQEFKRESFNMFTNMLEGLKRDAITTLGRIQIQATSEENMMERQRREAEAVQRQMQFVHADAGALTANDSEGEAAAMEMPETFVRESPKVGRNAPCPCGSGKKYKQCHGKIA